MSRTVEHMYASYYNIYALWVDGGVWLLWVIYPSGYAESPRCVCQWRFIGDVLKKLTKNRLHTVHYNIIDFNPTDDRAKECYDIVLSRKAF